MNISMNSVDNTSLEVQVFSFTVVKQFLNVNKTDELLSFYVSKSKKMISARVVKMFKMNASTS